MPYERIKIYLFQEIVICYEVILNLSILSISKNQASKVYHYQLA